MERKTNKDDARKSFHFINAHKNVIMREKKEER